MSKDKELTDLEKEFVAALKEGNALIGALVAESDAAIRAAIKVSEKYGIPFEAGSNGIYNTYTPKSFKKKWADIEDLYEFTEVVGRGTYWEFSAVCY